MQSDSERTARIRGMNDRLRATGLRPIRTSDTGSYYSAVGGVLRRMGTLHGGAHLFEGYCFAGAHKVGPGCNWTMPLSS